MASDNGHKPADAAVEHGAELTARPRRRRGRRLALLLAVAGGIAYALKRRQQRQDLDEGVWHEAPTAYSTPS